MFKVDTSVNTQQICLCFYLNNLVRVAIDELLTRRLLSCENLAAAAGLCLKLLWFSNYSDQNICRASLRERCIYLIKHHLRRSENIRMVSLVFICSSKWSKAGETDE